MTAATISTLLLGIALWLLVARMFIAWWRGRPDDDDGGGSGWIGLIGPEPGQDWAWWAANETPDRDEALTP